MSNVAVVNFNGGEFTQKIDARGDTEQYSGGCRILSNMIPSKFGGATRRPGTEWISRTASFNTMVTDIISHENEGLCHENSVVNTSYDAFLSQIVCHEDEIVCHDNEVVVDSRLMSQAANIICHNNEVVFHNNEILFL